MGCVVCGRRQVDPDSGPSTWRRAVVVGEQVLVCPDCQTDGWTDGLDRCAQCGSTVLVKRLGEVVCRGCGHVGASVAAPGANVEREGSPREALAADVAAALDRVLRADPTA
ncbi:hypothetical protein [Longivirga aurantiaca]|uniref:Uncharacterized protein n=1 Tax=Longivirga aurantiaca TaxID=1837743 RepID=A0ABW1T514_9ACTN